MNLADTDYTASAIYSMNCICCGCISSIHTFKVYLQDNGK